MNKTYKYTLTAHEKKEISFDTGVARLAIANGDGVDGSTTVVMSEITKQHSGDLVSFIDGADAPFAELTVNITAQQSGSGDPSPTNVRPITGWTGANVYVSDEDTSDPTTYNINWEDEAGTVYGGQLNVKTGVLTVTHTLLHGSDFTWEHTASHKHYSEDFNLDNIYKQDVTGKTIKCNVYKQGNAYDGVVDLTCNLTRRIWILDENITTEDFNTLMQTATFLVEYTTPVTYQLTPTEIRSLLGVNNVWADCGAIDVRYFVQSTQPMIDYIDDKTENVVEVIKATGHLGGTYTLDDMTCDELCTYARDHSNIVIKATRGSSPIAYDIFILSDYIGTSAVFRNAIITTAIGGGYVLEVRELQADKGNSTNALTVRYININADS